MHQSAVAKNTAIPSSKSLLFLCFFLQSDRYDLKLIEAFNVGHSLTIYNAFTCMYVFWFYHNKNWCLFVCLFVLVGPRTLAYT